jgi:hypothetical protein
MTKINWVRVVLGGLAAGVIINAFEYGGHRVLLDESWTAAFRALGKLPLDGRRSYLPISWSGS